MLISKEGLKRVEYLSKHSPVLAAAYITTASKTAAKVLLKQDTLYPTLDYLSDDRLELERKVDFSLLHTLFSIYASELPEELAKYNNLTTLLRVLWMAHTATLKAVKAFPGLAPVWSDFFGMILVPKLESMVYAVRSPKLALVISTLISWLKDTSSPFYSEEFSKALKELIDREMGLELPPDPVAAPSPELDQELYGANPKPSFQEEEASAEAEPPAPPTEESQRQQNAAPDDPLAAAMEALERHLEGMHALNDMALTSVPQVTRSQVSDQLEAAVQYQATVFPSLSGEEEYAYWEVLPDAKAKAQYAVLADFLRPHYEQLRHLFEALFHEDLERQLASTGRLHSYLLPKAFTVGTLPYVRVEPKEGSTLHMVFLVDESGSMGTTVSIPSNGLEQVPGTANISEALLGQGYLLHRDRATLAKLIAIMFYEALKTSDVEMSFYGYSSSSLPSTLPFPRSRSPWVRKLADKTNPYGLASITKVSGNADYEALSHAYQELKHSGAKHRVVLYLADGEVTDANTKNALSKMLDEGIHIFWLDLSGRSKKPKDSALAPASWYPVNTYQDAVQALEKFFREMQ